MVQGRDTYSEIEIRGRGRVGVVVVEDSTRAPWLGGKIWGCR